MTFLIRFPMVLSLIILAAHFLRESSLGLVFLCLLCPFFLLIHERWSARVIQAVLLLGALVWIFSAFSIGQERMAAGRPFVRMAVILGSVALVSAASAFLFYLPSMKKRYKLGATDRLS